MASGVRLVIALAVAFLACSDSRAPANRLRQPSSCAELQALFEADTLKRMDADIDAIEARIRAYGTPPTTKENFVANVHSSTTTQVPGVDEPDIVKNDGENVYLLHDDTLRVIRAWPAAGMHELGAIAIEGRPLEMFVDGSRAVVFSAVETPLYDAAGVPRHAGLGWFSSQGWWASSGFTKITIVAVDSTPRVLRELYYEGSYVSARRTGSVVRMVLRGAAFGPELLMYPTQKPLPFADPVDAWERLREENHARIDRATISDWLPYTFERTGSGITATLEKCESQLVPPIASTQWGRTQIVSFDVGSRDAPDVLSIAADALTVYANETTMIVAASRWQPAPTDWTNHEGSAMETHLHWLDLEALVPSYVGSRTIPGGVDDQYSIDVQGGVTRVATTNDVWHRDATTMAWSVERSTGVYAIALARDGSPEVIGSVEHLAPGETLFASRFVGDRGYLVTFRRKDPLFVLDLSNPGAPRVVGEITIPGFSEFMQPMDNEHILTIGRDTDSNGRALGLALQIFDVSDPTTPTLAQKYVYDPSSYGWSNAEYDPKALTYYPDRKMVSFPFSSYSAQTRHATAELFRVDVDGGITHLGSIDHARFFSTNARCPIVRRGVFIEDTLYSISFGGILANDTATLASESSLVLPPATSCWP